MNLPQVKWNGPRSPKHQTEHVMCGCPQQVNLVDSMKSHGLKHKFKFREYSRFLLSFILNLSWAAKCQNDFARFDRTHHPLLEMLIRSYPRHVVGNSVNSDFCNKISKFTHHFSQWVNVFRSSFCSICVKNPQVSHSSQHLDLDINTKFERFISLDSQIFFLSYGREVQIFLTMLLTAIHKLEQTNSN